MVTQVQEELPKCASWHPAEKTHGHPVDAMQAEAHRIEFNVRQHEDREGFQLLFCQRNGHTGTDVVAVAGGLMPTQRAARLATLRRSTASIRADGPA
jgi:hypothetical protein